MSRVRDSFKHKININDKAASMVLLFCVLLAITQVVVIFSLQNEGFKNILSALTIASIDAGSEVTDVREYIEPQNVIMGNRHTNNRYILIRNDEYYLRFMNDYTLVMKNILDRKPDAVSEYSEDAFMELMIKKEITVQYGYDMPGELLCWYAGVSGKQYQGPDKIKTIVIAPEDQDRQNKNCIYLYDGRQAYVYYYETDMVEDCVLAKQSVDKQYISMESNPDYGIYSFAYEILSSVFPTRRDMPILIRENNAAAISGFRCDIPVIFSLIDSNVYNGYEELAGAFLSRDAEKYVPSKNESAGYISFRKINSIYNIYNTGLAEFTKQSREVYETVPACSEAYSEAAEYISQREAYMTGKTNGMYIRLTEVVFLPDEGYTFKFNYYIVSNEIMSDIELDIQNFDAGSVKNPSINDAITMTVNSDGIRDMVWLACVPVRGGSRIRANIDFVSMAEAAADVESVGVSVNVISDARVVYLLRASRQSQQTFYIESMDANGVYWRAYIPING